MDNCSISRYQMRGILLHVPDFSTTRTVYNIMKHSPYDAEVSYFLDLMYNVVVPARSYLT